MDFLIKLLAEYGYIIVFVWTLLEGETIVAIAGFAAYLGHLKLGYIIPIAIVGAVAGDQFFFWLGRLKGKTLLERRPKLAGRVERVHQLTARYHSLIIVASRFMYGFRTIIPISFGASGMSPLRYFAFNLLGAIIWAPTFALGGYAFGSAIETFLGNAKKFEVGIVVGLLVIAGILQLISSLRRDKGESLIVGATKASLLRGKKTDVT
jgi:membrane protein DedA with SNARE-associated domain